MDAILTLELDGQTSINDLLEEPVGASPVQLALPIHFPPASEVPARS